MREGNWKMCDRCQIYVNSATHTCIPPHGRCHARQPGTAEQCGKYAGHEGSHSLFIDPSFLEAGLAPRLGRDMDHSTDWQAMGKENAPDG